MMMTRLTIDFSTEGTRVFAEGDTPDTPAIDETFVSTDVFAALAKASAETETPYLPGQHGVIKYRKKGKDEFFIYVEPARETTLKYMFGNDNYYSVYAHDDDSDDRRDLIDTLKGIREFDEEVDDYVLNFQTVVPALIWFVHLTKQDERYYFQRTRLFASKDTFFTPTTTALYLAPLSNVYHGTSDVCWGNDTTVSVPTALSIQGLSSLFFRSYANEDLDDSRVSTVEDDTLYSTSAFYLHYKVDELDSTVSFSSKLNFVHDHLKPVGHSLGDVFDLFCDND